jgi:S-adenosylmethionine decarboxylase
MEALGKHVIAELYGCNSEILNNQELIEDIMLEAVELSGATIVKPVFHKFSPHGVSGMVVVSESHFAIHTWPEYGYCALDIFTCGDLINNQIALDYLKKKFESSNISVVEMKRGLLDLGVELRHKPIGV